MLRTLSFLAGCVLLTAPAHASEVALRALRDLRTIGTESGVRSHAPSAESLDLIPRGASGWSAGMLNTIVNGTLVSGVSEDDYIPPLPQDGLYRIVIPATETQTGYLERFLLYIPAGVGPNERRPLLVAWHSYSHWEDEIVLDTDFQAECEARRWYLLAPLSVHDYGQPKINYGSLNSQSNTRDAISWVMNHVKVDRSRIYGVGFSMGGGGMATYVARHVDPTHAMFAAVVNHTGSVALHHSYNASVPTRPVMAYVLGGTPAEALFTYQRSSVIHLQPSNETLLENDSMARNLKYAATRTHVASGDPLAHLATQSARFHDHLETFGGEVDLSSPRQQIHSWDTLDETEVCDFLAAHTLQMPMVAKTMADQDGKYFHFDIAQQEPGDFTLFSWNSLIDLNRLYIYWTTNLARIQADMTTLQLDTTQVVELVVQTNDGGGDEIVLTGYPTPPQRVDFNFVENVNWVHDPATATLTLPGDAPPPNSTAFHQWTITP